MDVKKTDIYIVDGSADHGTLALESRFRHLKLAELPVGSLPENAFFILDSKFCELHDVIGAFFRQKRPFAFASVCDIDEDGDLVRLCETARRKKSRAWMLGGLRVLPVVASTKEIITGGCLGELKSFSVVSGFEKGDEEGRMLHDAVAWMCGAQAKQNEGGVEPGIERTFDGKSLEITAVGSAGELFAEYDFKEGKGSMTTTVNHHRRTRSFGAANARTMELNLLAAFVPTMTATLPGLVPLRELATSLKGLGD